MLTGLLAKAGLHIGADASKTQKSSRMRGQLRALQKMIDSYPYLRDYESSKRADIEKIARLEAETSTVLQPEDGPEKIQQATIA